MSDFIQATFSGNGGSAVSTETPDFAAADEDAEDGNSLGRCGRARHRLRHQAFDLWLAMATQAEIARAIGYTVPEVSKFIDRTLLPNGGSAVSQHTPDPDADDAADEDAEDGNSLARFKLTREQRSAEGRGISRDDDRS